MPSRPTQNKAPRRQEHAAAFSCPSTNEVLLQDRTQRPYIRFDHGMDVVDRPASTLPDKVVSDLVLALRFTHPIVRRERRDDARMRSVSRERLDCKSPDFQPLGIRRNVEIDCAESVACIVRASIAPRP